jgi:hypothetical protein
VGKFKFFLESRTRILKKSHVYVFSSFHSPATLPQCQHSRDYIDFITTLQTHRISLQFRCSYVHKLSLISPTFHCHNCSQKTGNKASWNLITKWLAKKTHNQCKFPPPRIHDATDYLSLVIRHKQKFCDVCLFVCQYAPQQLWRPIIVCNSLITQQQSLLPHHLPSVSHLITWWSANRSIDVVVFVNCALSSVSAGYLPKSRKVGGGEEKNRCWQGGAQRERKGHVAWGSWERKLREEKETVVPESGWQSEEAFLGLVRNNNHNGCRKKEERWHREDGRTDGAPWHPSSNSMPGYSQDLQELYTWESSKSSLYPGLGLSTGWSTVSFACIQDLV